MATKGEIKGRGARSNATSRFIADKREAFDDGWEPDAEEDALPRLDTQLMPERARRIISTNDSPDIGFDRSINPYKGCEHGCIYCYARPNHAYLGLSPGQDFETKIYFKPEGARLLEAELSKPSYRPKRIHIGGDTDPYQPAEKKLGITRGILEVFDRFNHPVSIITKSHLITRDVDILGRLAARNLASACISITTLGRTLARDMEPRAATPTRRLDAIKKLSDAGVPVMVGFAPVIPGLNDQEMEAVLEAAAQAGATRAMFVTLRLPLEIKDLFREWLAEARPDRASKIMSLIRQARGGRDYDPEWGSRMKGTGPLADILAQRFAAACRRYKLNTTRVEADLTAFRVPPKPGDQMSLFDAA